VRVACHAMDPRAAKYMVEGEEKAQLAEKVGVDQRMISHWERRSVTLKPEQIVAPSSGLGHHYR
jgi:hypothetical protein